MSLEDILAPIKAVDQEILRLYTRLTNRWEEKGKSKYSLAANFDLAAVAGNVLLKCAVDYSLQNQTVPTTGDSTFSISSIIMPILMGSYVNNIVNTIYNLANKEDSIGSELAEDKYNSITTKVNRGVRMFGWMATGRFGIFALGGNLITAAHYPLEEWMVVSSATLASVSIASSKYIKDSNPKLLDKKPLLRTAWDKVKDTYHQAKEKIKAKIPEPQPVLYPVPTSHFGRY